MNVAEGPRQRSADALKTELVTTKHGPNNIVRDSSVSIMTSYGLEGPGIDSRWGRDFPHLSRPALRPTQPPAPGQSRG
jgi:hypothetical protein